MDKHAERLARNLLARYHREGTFNVAFHDPGEAQAVMASFENLGCSVTIDWSNTCLTVVCLHAPVAVHPQAREAYLG